MNVVWKYPISPGLSQHQMPSGATPLAVDVQGGAPCLWVLVDPDAALVDRRIETVGTGIEFERAPGSVYVGTFQMLGGALVFHTFMLHEEARR